MENESFVINKALAIINENNSELKNVYANKALKLAAGLSTSTSPRYYIVEITADQPDANDPSQFERKQFQTVASDMTSDDWKMIFEMYGWSNVRAGVLHQDAQQHNLFKNVSNDAVTESTVPKANGAEAISYFVEIPFVDDAGNEDKKVFVTQPSYMTFPNFTKFLSDTIMEIQSELRTAGSKIKIKAPNFGRAKGPGSFQFDQIRHLFSTSLASTGGFTGSGTGLAQQFAWQIDCRSTAGNEYVFRTIKSDTPVELYEQKLRDVGFTGIRSKVTSKPGTLQLADIDMRNIVSLLNDNLRKPDTFENLEKGIGELQDKFETSNFGKAMKTIKRIHDWIKK